MFWRTDIQWAGLQITLHDTELVFNLCQPMIFFDHFKRIHRQFGKTVYIILQFGKAFVVLRVIFLLPVTLQSHIKISM